MKISGAHAIVYSKDAEADRRFLRDVLGLPNVDVGDGWLVFALPPSELAVHPAEKNDVHELYLMVEDVGALAAALAKRGVECTPPRDLGWGVLAQLTLPGGGRLGAYEPRHARPTWPKSSSRPGARRNAARRKKSVRTKARGRTRRRG
jgi:catechol 2,3-dioxygenase-like lactoylglutathione lyase family enzyme